MAKQSEGAAVRVSMDGPSIEHDALIDQIEARIREEYARSSDASESGAKTTEFLDETGMNSQAFAWCKTILKKLPKKDGQTKAMDIIRSLETALPLVKAHVGGQPDMFDRAASDLAPAAPVEPVTLADVAHLTGDDGDDEDDGFPADQDEDDEGPFDDDDLGEDDAAFADAVADLEPAGNVVKAFRR